MALHGRIVSKILMLEPENFNASKDGVSHKCIQVHRQEPPIIFKQQIESGSIFSLCKAVFMVDTNLSGFVGTDSCELIPSMCRPPEQLSPADTFDVESLLSLPEELQNRRQRRDAMYTFGLGLLWSKSRNSPTAQDASSPPSLAAFLCGCHFRCSCLCDKLFLFFSFDHINHFLSAAFHSSSLFFSLFPPLLPTREPFRSCSVLLGSCGICNHAGVHTEALISADPSRRDSSADSTICEV